MLLVLALQLSTIVDKMLSTFVTFPRRAQASMRQPYAIASGAMRLADHYLGLFAPVREPKALESLHHTGVGLS